MKKIIALSVLLSAASAGLLSAAPSFAQTVTVPITGGQLNVEYNGLVFLENFTSSTVLTPLGAVSISSTGFNGTITSTTIYGNQNSAVTSSNFFLFDFGFNDGATSTLQFNGTTTGTGPTGAFTNSPTTINSTFVRDNFHPGFSRGFSGGFFGATNVTGGSITLPAPVIPAPVIPAPVSCTGCLIVRPQDLLISNSTLQYSEFNKPEYRQEYRNDFSRSSFDRDRILGGLEDK